MTGSFLDSQTNQIIIGCCIGGGLLIIIIVVIAVCCYQKRQRRKRAEARRKKQEERRQEQLRLMSAQRGSSHSDPNMHASSVPEVDPRAWMQSRPVTFVSRGGAADITPSTAPSTALGSLDLVGPPRPFVVTARSMSHADVGRMTSLENSKQYHSNPAMGSAGSPSMQAASWRNIGGSALGPGHLPVFRSATGPVGSIQRMRNTTSGGSTGILSEESMDYFSDSRPRVAAVRANSGIPRATSPDLYSDPLSPRINRSTGRVDRSYVNPQSPPSRSPPGGRLQNSGKQASTVQLLNSYPNPTSPRNDAVAPFGSQSRKLAPASNLTAGSQIDMGAPSRSPVSLVPAARSSISLSHATGSTLPMKSSIPPPPPPPPPMRRDSSDVYASVESNGKTLIEEDYYNYVDANHSSAAGSNAMHRRFTEEDYEDVESPSKR